MKIVHVAMEMFKTSGISEFCKQVAERHARAGIDTTLLVSHDYDNIVNDEVRVINEQRLDVLDFRPDLVHIQSLWSPFSARAMKWCLKHKVPYVVSPHGCMMPRVFKKGWLKKHLFWWLFLKSSVMKAKLIHCTSEAEEIEVKKRLGAKAPRTVVVPLGTDLPENELEKVVGDGGFKALFLGRISDEKGLPTLLDAWKRIYGEGDELILAGPDWRGYEARLREKVEVEKIGGVKFVGRADQAKKDELFREVDVLVLSSPMENFSLVILEALARGVPVIATKGTPWGDVVEHRCGWWVEYSAEEIGKAIGEAKGMERGKLEEMGERGRKLVEEKYTWEAVAKSVEKEYAKLLYNKSK